MKVTCVCEKRPMKEACVHKKRPMKESYARTMRYLHGEDMDVIVPHGDIALYVGLFHRSLLGGLYGCHRTTPPPHTET